MAVMGEDLRSAPSTMRWYEELMGEGRGEASTHREPDAVGLKGNTARKVSPKRIRFCESLTKTFRGKDIFLT